MHHSEIQKPGVILPFYCDSSWINYALESALGPQYLLAEHVSNGTNLAHNSCCVEQVRPRSSSLLRSECSRSVPKRTETMKRMPRGHVGCCEIMRFLSSILLATASAAAMTPSYDHPSHYSVDLDLGHRRLGEAAPSGRHNSPPGRKRVKEEKEASRFSYYMTSDCRPSSSGYFGSTGGDPVLFEYGFELETTIFATMEKILNIISDRVMDEIITRTFSDMCGVYRRRVQDVEGEPTSASASMGSGRVTGFHFGDEEVVPSSKINSFSIHEPPMHHFRRPYLQSALRRRFSPSVASSDLHASAAREELLLVLCEPSQSIWIQSRRGSRATAGGIRARCIAFWPCRCGSKRRRASGAG